MSCRRLLGFVRLLFISLAYSSTLVGGRLAVDLQEGLFFLLVLGDVDVVDVVL